MADWLLLCEIARTLRAFATYTRCPHASNNRLTHGEWVPVSKTIVAAGNRCENAVSNSRVFVITSRDDVARGIEDAHRVPTIPKIHPDR